MSSSVSWNGTKNLEFRADTKTSRVRAFEVGVVESFKTNTGQVSKIYTVQIQDWARPHVDKPRARSVADFTRAQEGDSRKAAAMQQARKRLAPNMEACEGESLRTLRLKKGWSQAELARRIERSQPQVARLESKRQDPTLSTLKRIANILEIDIETVVRAVF